MHHEFFESKGTQIPEAMPETIFEKPYTRPSIPTISIPTPREPQTTSSATSTQIKVHPPLPSSSNAARNQNQPQDRSIPLQRTRHENQSPVDNVDRGNVPASIGPIPERLVQKVAKDSNHHRRRLLPLKEHSPNQRSTSPLGNGRDGPSEALGAVASPSSCAVSARTSGEIGS